MSKPLKEDLQAALGAAGSAHHDYEVNILNGSRDEHWAGWYAAYVLGRLGDFTSPSNVAQWLSEAPGSDEWAASAAEYVLQNLA